MGVWWDLATVILLAGTATVLLASPWFPSQDGPVHLYYVDILRGLLAHAGPYSQYFQLKTLLTPYAIEYYSLLALETLFSPAVSEKLMICCYIFTFGFGFRYLVGAVSSERRNPWTLVGIPFCMNLLVYLGFLNYCLGVALTLWMSGLWIRYSERLTPGRVAAILAGFVVMLLAHPIAVAIFLLFLGLHFVVEVSLAAAVASWTWIACLRQRWRPLTLILVMAGTALAWIGMFISDADPGPALPNFVGQFGLLRVVKGELTMWQVSPFTSHLYCAGLTVLAGVAGLTLVQHSWRQEGRLCSVAIAMVATSAICFTLFCFVPPQINGTWFFAQRFPIFAVMFLIAAAAALRPSRSWSTATGILALFVTIGVIAAQWMYVSQIGKQMRPVLEAPAAKPGSIGLIIAVAKVYPEGLSFDPYMWGGVHYFRRSRAILANTPWMDQTHILLRPVHPDRWSFLDPDEEGGPLSKAWDAEPQVLGLDFMVQAGLYDQELDHAIGRTGLRPFSDRSEFLRLYRRQP